MYMYIEVERELVRSDGMNIIWLGFYIAETLTFCALTRNRIKAMFRL